jgi:PAS domain S-box-containing protein
MVVGAAALALTAAAAGIVLASWGPIAVADAVADNSRSRAVTQAMESAHSAAVQSAAHVDALLLRVKTATQRIAAGARKELAAPDVGANVAPSAFQPLGTTGLSWTPVDDDGFYSIPVDAQPSDDHAARLARLARRIGPFLRAAIDSDEGVVHAAVWIDGTGVVGAVPPYAKSTFAPRPPVAGLGASALTGGEPCDAGWLAPGERIAGERVVSFVVTVSADPHESRAAAVVVVDASCDVIASTLSRHAARQRAAAAIVTGDGDLVASTVGLAARLGVATSDDAVVDALRGVVGAPTLAHAPDTGTDVDHDRALATAAGVPCTGWTVVAMKPPASRTPAFTDGALGAEQAARRQAYGFVALTLLFGGAVALGAFALADSFRRRLRPILEGAAAHARGELDHAIDATDDDELGELAMSLDTTATRLRRNLGRLEESERRLVSLIESMGEGFVITDADDRVVFVNQRFSEMVKRPASDVVGRYVEEMLVPESLDRHREESAWRKKGRPGQYEVAWQTRGARPARTIVSAMPMFDGAGAYVGGSCVVTDVTDRLGAQEERARTEKLRALGEMAGGVAHDFNNLLTVMLGNAQLLYMESLSDDAKRTVASIEEAALECAERVRRVTEFTKSRAVGADATDVDPNLVVSESVAVAKARRAADAAKRGVSYVVDVRCGARRVVRGDAREMRNALVNLLDNAFDAMERGGRVVVESCDRGDDSVAVRVEDTGMGMDDYVREKAFDPFFTTKHPGRCAGLGLSIVDEIVRAHGGRVDVKSTQGTGSTFTMVFPARRPAAAPGAGARAPAAEPPRPRVLLVGVGGSDALQRGLHGLGVQAAAACSPGEALGQLVDPAAFNTLVVEHDFSPTGGWALAEAARAARSDLRILLLAPAGRVVDGEVARAAGIDRVLARPFDIQDLRAIVFSLLVAPPTGRADRRAAAEAGPATSTQSASVDVWGVRDDAAQAVDGPIPMRNP